MKFSYYPGCTLKTKAKILDKYTRESASALGVELEEINEWQCCGGVFTTSNDEIATKLSSLRAIIAAKDKGQKLVTVCAACHNVLKQTNYQFNNDSDFAFKANNYMKLDTPYEGNGEVIHFLELLRDEVSFEEIAKKVKNPLEGKKIAPYYGCLLLRPGKVMQMDDSENPQILENLVKAMGAEAVVSPYRNECCGGYIALEDGESAKRKSISILENAKKMGADTIITACPLCKYNLEKHAEGIEIKYFTELLAEALGVKEGCANE